MYSILSSGLASAMKSSTPAFSAMYFAVSGLSPVTITVFTPILRRRSKRSRMPGLDDVLQFDHAPDLLVLADHERRAAVLRDAAHRPSTLRRAFVAGLGGDADGSLPNAPLRMRRPSGMSTPEHLVSAVNLHHLHADQLQVDRPSCPFRRPARRRICLRASRPRPKRARTGPEHL